MFPTRGYFLFHFVNSDAGREEKIPTEVYFAIVTKPLGRVTVVGINVLQGDREMDQEEVEIINTPKLKLFLGQLFDLLL